METTGLHIWSYYKASSCLPRKRRHSCPFLQRPRSLSSHPGSLLHAQIHHSYIYIFIYVCSHVSKAAMHCIENTQMLCETHKCLHVRAQTRPHTLPLKGSLPLQPVLHSLSKLLQHAGQMNVSHFLFTSDLPLSPCKPEEGDWKRRGEPDRGSGERKKRGERKNRGPASSSSFSLHISSLSLSLLFSFCLSKGELGGQSLATSNLQPVHLACYRRSPFVFFFSFLL